MPTKQTNDVIEHIRRIVLLRDGAGVTDGQLLEDYVCRREDAALAGLVRRHGPMVWGVCRRVLRNHHDAEDAFQATFLVLVRKAASIVPREMVANWLYGVAQQTARKARATAAKRAEREMPMRDLPEPGVEERELWRDLQPLLDEELSRLPAKYRAPLVLCDLTGASRKEAARQLGVPEGTVAGRLARARVMLAKRLVRRGVLLSSGALALMLVEHAASASVPLSLVTSTIKAANLFAAGQAGAASMVSVKAVALTNGVLKSMFATQLKTMLATMLAVTVLGGSIGLLALRTMADEKDEKPKAETKKADQDAAKAKSDKEKLQGTWTATSLEIDGKDYSNKLSKGWNLVFEGDNVKGVGKGGAGVTFKLDSERKPKGIDFDVEAGSDLTRKAIYELDRNTLKLCWSRGSERPTEFDSTKAILAVFERKKE
ncbi:MAG TPA: sigma-70 family RNA polymerase sigma factor [Gemmataceae bacterium]|jgi:RNA polymerase sigma factor (sigma-70 family)|nr:sigma-70 family RNA polymerase sigma factor [Gemmataceae bacterium]